MNSPPWPRLGVGAGSLANAGGEPAFLATVRTAWQAGIRFFDTSAFYLGGESEKRLGEALETVPRDDLVISTKVGRYQNHTGSSIDPHSRQSWFDYSAEATEQSVLRSLDRLKVKRLDAVFVHDLDHRLCGSRYQELLEAALTGAYPVLRKMKADGIVGAVGVAAMDWRACLQFAQVTELDLVMPAGEYSLLRNTSAPLLDYCVDFNIGWIAASPFNSGILATGARDDAFYDMRPATPAVLAQVERLDGVCRRHGVPLAAAAVQYPGRHPAVASVVFGAKSVAEFEETQALYAFPLPGAFWSEIDDLIARSGNWEGL